jgi:hypothetical protein
MHRDRRHRMHVGLGDVFDDHRDVVVPTTYRLVVRSGDKSAIIIHKGNGVDWAEMLIIGLDNLVRAQVVLPSVNNIIDDLPE